MTEFRATSAAFGWPAAAPAESPGPPAPQPAADVRRVAERLVNPGGAFQAAVRLALQPQSEPLRYAVAVRWEERLHGDVTRTVVEKQLALSCVAQGPHLLVTWAAEQPPELRKRDRLPQEDIAVLLAGLYRRLTVKTAASGRFLALADSEARPAWAEIEAELDARYGPDDALVAGLKPAVTAQVHDPERLFVSLQYDYAYRLLLPDVYGQRFENGMGYVQPKTFPQFLPEVDLHFHERLEVGAPAAPGRATLLLSGRLDEQQTDRIAAAQQVAAALARAPGARAPGPPSPDPATLAFAYHSTYDLDAATGWPVAVAAVVSCQSPAGYAKEYDLTIDRL